MTRCLFASLAVAALVVSPVRAGPVRAAQTMSDANKVLVDLAAIPVKAIPPALLAEAQGIAILPAVVKAGFVVAGRGGHGLVIAKDANGNWGEPAFVNFGSASVGFQAGIQWTDLVLVFRSRKGLDQVLAGKGKITLGVDVSVAAGPVGRQAMLATDGRLEAEILSYCLTQGLFAGVALDGAWIGRDEVANTQFRSNVWPLDAQLAEALRGRLTMMGPPPPAVPPVSASPPIPLRP